MPLNLPAPESVSSPGAYTLFPSGSLPFVLISLFLSLVIVWGGIHQSLTFFFFFVVLPDFGNTKYNDNFVLPFWIFFFFGICIFHKREVRGCSPLMWSKKPGADEEGGSWSESGLSDGEEPSALLNTRVLSHV